MRTQQLVNEDPTVREDSPVGGRHRDGVDRAHVVPVEDVPAPRVVVGVVPDLVVEGAAEVARAGGEESRLGGYAHRGQGALDALVSGVHDADLLEGGEPAEGGAEGRGEGRKCRHEREEAALVIAHCHDLAIRRPLRKGQGCALGGADGRAGRSREVFFLSSTV